MVNEFDSVGFDSVGFDSELELDELFSKVDRIGRKYQSVEEMEAFEQALYELNREIEELAAA